MAFTGKEGNPISLSKARQWSKNYRDKAGKGAVYAQFMGCDIINEILAQTNADGHCKGIRIYYGLDDDGTPHLMLVGATEDEKNMLPSDENWDGSKSSTEGSDAIVANDGVTCPPSCGDDGL